MTSACAGHQEGPPPPTDYFPQDMEMTGPGWRYEYRCDFYRSGFGQAGLMGPSLTARTDQRNGACRPWPLQNPRIELAVLLAGTRWNHETILDVGLDAERVRVVAWVSLQQSVLPGETVPYAWYQSADVQGSPVEGSSGRVRVTPYEVDPVTLVPESYRVELADVVLPLVGGETSGLSFPGVVAFNAQLTYSPE